MSLCTDQLFYKALSQDADIIELTEGRIFNTSRNEEDETEDRIPYIIITYDGMQNDQGSKDDQGESDYDHETISVIVVADNREALAALMLYVRPCLKKAIAEQDEESEIEYGFRIDDYTLTASSVECDPTRPCHYQILTYACETLNIE